MRKILLGICILVFAASMLWAEEPICPRYPPWWAPGYFCLEGIQAFLLYDLGLKYIVHLYPEGTGVMKVYDMVDGEWVLVDEHKIEDWTLPRSIVP